MTQTPPLILASSSPSRRAMLLATGLSFTVEASNIDESLTVSTTPDDIALELARAKALDVARHNTGSLVIGADQVLALNGQIFIKAKNKDGARQSLKRLRGKTHNLHCAVVVARNESILWEHNDTAHLTMHAFNDPFLERYMEKAGDVLTTTVGAYALEGLGIQLFDTIQGEYFTILGLPLLPLLRYLREEQGIGL